MSVNRISLITQPKYLSNALCEVIGVPHGARMQKFKVIQLLAEYCASHNLVSNNSIIINRKLSKLLTAAELGGVFNSRLIDFAVFRNVISNHLSNIPVTSLEYSAKCDRSAINDNDTRDIVIYSLEELVDHLHNDEKYHLLSLLVNDLQNTVYASF
jgi:hypothetical protein